MVKWKQGQNWQEISNIYLSYVQHLGRLLLLMAIAAHQNITVYKMQCARYDTPDTKAEVHVQCSQQNSSSLANMRSDYSGSVQQ